MRWAIFIFVTAVAVASLTTQPSRAQTDPWAYAQDQVQRSIAGYHGECPCPYSKDKSGQTCGDKSAYLQKMPKNGFIPFCYTTDVFPWLADPPKPEKAHAPIKLPGQPI